MPNIRGRIEKRGREVSERWRRLGLNLNWADLLYPGERNDVVAYLTTRGSEATARSTPELHPDYGFEFPDERSMVAFDDIRYVTAVLP